MTTVRARGLGAMLRLASIVSLLTLLAALGVASVAPAASAQEELGDALEGLDPGGDDAGAEDGTDDGTDDGFGDDGTDDGFGDDTEVLDESFDADGDAAPAGGVDAGFGGAAVEGHGGPIALASILLAAVALAHLWYRRSALQA